MTLITAVSIEPAAPSAPPTIPFTTSKAAIHDTFGRGAALPARVDALSMLSPDGWGS
ncbi:hypothetical protein FRC12_010805 [Ceratobasidium sp. 428]|nr:hypothetical protein FRC12_010805 [Ceratobasidium sp. 428]